MKSIIQPKNEITNDHWVVSVVERHLHLFLIVESFQFDKDPGYKMRVFDFLPEDPHALQTETHTQIASTWLENKSLKGRVRETLFDLYYDHNDIGLETPVAPEIVQYMNAELFRQNAWKVDQFKSWAIPKEDATRMLESIALDKESNLTFNYRGKGKDLNCTHWAEEKLKVAGIKPSHHDHIINIFAIHPGTLTHVNHPHLRAIFHPLKKQRQSNPEQNVDNTSHRRFGFRRHSHEP